MSSPWPRRVLVGAAVGGGLVLASRARYRRLLAADEDECGPDPRLLPDGRSLTVRTEDGAELAVTVAGPDDGRTVVLAHCWMGGRTIWATTARLLVEDGYRVVMYDQRGHGESSLSEAALTIDGLGHDLRAVLEATDTTDAILAGHSMGGMTIQAYAGVHPEHFADRVDGVVLVATAARTIGRALPVGVAERILGDASPGWTRRGAMGRRMTRGALGRVAHPAHVAVTMECLDGTQGLARAGFLDAMAVMDLRANLAGITVPTAVLVGTRDRLTAPARARELASMIPDAELIVLPHKGHMLPLEAPRAVTEAIRSVAARASGREAALPR